MLTIFSTPKPFIGHSEVIQCNAIESWTLLHPDIEIILFGDEEGAAAVSQRFNIRHEPEVQRHANGPKYLNYMFDRAQEIARHRILCYVNCDIVLMSDFRRSVERVASRWPQFLMVGRRRDVDIKEPWNFLKREWEQVLTEYAMTYGRERPSQWIDYFVFSAGTYLKGIPPFVIGRPGWDNWLLWYARRAGNPVLDASGVVTAVHQNHDYSYHPDGKHGVWEGLEAQENYALLRNGRCFATIDNATHRLTSDGFSRNYRHWIIKLGRVTKTRWKQVWFAMLNITRPIRHAVGLRQSKSV